MVDLEIIKNRIQKLRDTVGQLAPAGPLVKTRDHGNNWYHQERQNQLAERGNRCAICDSHDNLEFAHLTETELSGEGRGRNARVLDVKHHPKSYILLCRSCHDKFDQRNTRGGPDEREGEASTNDEEPTYFD